MSNIRYEDYRAQERTLPYSLYEGLVRTPTARSEKPNFHEEYEVEFCHSGEGFALIDGERVAFSEGDILIIHPGEIHYTGSEDTLLYSALIFDGTLFSRLGLYKNASPQFPHRIHSDEAEKAFSTLIKLHREQPTYMLAHSVSALIDLLLALTPFMKEDDGSHTVRKNDTVIRALEYIRIHHAEHLSLDALASALYISKFTLCRLFRQYTGESVVTHIHRVRIGVASQLLAEGQSVSEVAGAVGFENLSFFIRTFKRYIGKTPSAFQKEMLKKG